MVWANGGTQLYFTSLHIDEPYYERPKTDLYSVAVNGGEPAKINSFDMDTRDLALSPDGKQIAFVASTSEPIISYTEPDLWVVDVTPIDSPIVRPAPEGVYTTPGAPFRVRCLGEVAGEPELVVDFAPPDHMRVTVAGRGFDVRAA